METLSSPVRVAQATHTGNIRSNNEDAFGWFSVPAGELFLVADGIGGNVGGEAASTCAIKAFSEAMQNVAAPSQDSPSLAEPGQAAENLGEALSLALLYADRSVQHLWEEKPELLGCGTTLAALLLTPSSAWHIHAGDSRVYQFSCGRLRQLGRDHSAVQDMLAAGQITEAQAKTAPKNVITQSLGGNVKASYCQPEEVPYCRGDKFLLCSDGLWGMVEDEKIEAFLKASPSAQENVDSLLQAALEAGGKDNVTLQVVECLFGREPSLAMQTPRKQKIPAKALPLVVCLLLIFILAGFCAVFFEGSEGDTATEDATVNSAPSQGSDTKPDAPKEVKKETAKTTEKDESNNGKNAAETDDKLPEAKDAASETESAAPQEDKEQGVEGELKQQSAPSAQAGAASAVQGKKKNGTEFEKNLRGGSGSKKQASQGGRQQRDDKGKL